MSAYVLTRKGQTLETPSFISMLFNDKRYSVLWLLGTVLDQEGVCVRAAPHCAKPLMRRLNVPATVRASFYLYNDAGDVDALIGGLRKAAALFGVPA